MQVSQDREGRWSGWQSTFTPGASRDKIRQTNSESHETGLLHF